MHNNIYSIGEGELRMNKNTQKNLVKSIIFIITFMVILLINKKVNAKSYTIENMDIQATVLEEGSINIKQSITYNFNGSYNGIYITIPYSLNDDQAKEVNSSSKDYSLYNGNNVKINKIIDSKNVNYKEKDPLKNTQSNVDGRYEITKDEKKYTIKVYSKSEYVKKTFILDYNIENICVKHNDIGELYYNFIGGKWDVEIKKLNIDILLPNNKSKENLYAFGHGPYNGVITIESPNKVNFKVNNVKKRSVCCC